MLRGGFHPVEADRVPPLADARPVGTLFLVGNVGPRMWARFSASPETRLDAWSQRVLSRTAAALGAVAFFPFGGPPYLPFIPWAKRAEAVSESPLGMLIHPDHGLWHAYRGALGFAERFELPPRDTRPRPCDACVDKPCLSACPVGAFEGTRYDVAGCVTHIATPAGADCMNEGCRARRACPVGTAYEPAQARFHMRAFFESARSKVR